MEIINWADKALYKAKTSGRDRVSVAQAAEPEKDPAREGLYHSESAT